MVGWILLYVLTLGFYFSTALTEGWKWRSPAQHDYNALIRYSNYHVWRGVANACFLGMTLLAVYLGAKATGLRPLAVALLLHTSAWALYERALSFAQDDTPFSKRERFHILGIYLKRMEPLTEIMLGLAAFAASIGLLLSNGQ